MWYVAFRTGEHFMLTIVNFIFALFPAVVIGMELSMVFWMIVDPVLWKFFCVLLTPYILPLTTYRLATLVAPLGEGRSIMDREHYSPWTTAYRIQLLYVLFPFLESVLVAVPGLFSVWLRAWGSKIGKNVIWASSITVTDRGLIEVGNRVFVGDRVYMSPHVVNPSGDHLLLYIKRVRIGDDVFIGSGSRFGPGSEVADGAFVPILTDVYVNEHFPARKSSSRRKQ